MFPPFKLVISNPTHPGVSFVFKKIKRRIFSCNFWTIWLYAFAPVRTTDVQELRTKAPYE